MAVFRPNPPGIVALGATPEMIVMLKEHADRAVEEARATAPVITGHYRDSIVTDTGIDNAQAVARVLSTDFKANWIEFGTSKMAAHRTLRSAVESTGLKLTGGKS